MTSAPFLTFLLFFLFTVVGAFKLSVAFVLANTFTLGVTSALGFSSDPDATSLLCNSPGPSPAALLRQEVVAAPRDVDGPAVGPSSTKLMSSGETWALTPRDQVGCLEM